MTWNKSEKNYEWCYFHFMSCDRQTLREVERFIKTSLNSLKLQVLENSSLIKVFDIVCGTLQAKHATKFTSSARSRANFVS